jgi:hypothetical protein
MNVYLFELLLRKGAPAFALPRGILERTELQQLGGRKLIFSEI